MATFAFKLVKGVVGSTLLAGGTFAGLCYYTIWNADRQVQRIDDDLADLSKALIRAEDGIKTHLETLARDEKQKESIAKKVEDVKTNLSKAEEQVTRLKGDLQDFSKKLDEKKQNIVAQKQQTGLLQRIREERAESVSVRSVSLSPRGYC
mmetsp:Transcript_7164/g.13190  ORF Transcript_7164/g.13190 Transcript_7164/m.13190 type:complete len:150 (+) Transcript_7164:216-665(+)